MNEIITELETLFGRFSEESFKYLCNNKAAGVRARKISLVLEKKLKEFRSSSVAHDKQGKRS